jgi:hypothetical protein
MDLARFGPKHRSEFASKLLARRSPRPRCVAPLRAEGFAKVALERSLAPDCRFYWGAIAAGHLLGQTLIAQKR